MYMWHHIYFPPSSSDPSRQIPGFPVYHSAYETFHYVESFLDPTFKVRNHTPTTTQSINNINTFSWQPIFRCSITARWRNSGFTSHTASRLMTSSRSTSWRTVTQSRTTSTTSKLTLELSSEKMLFRWTWVRVFCTSWGFRREIQSKLEFSFRIFAKRSAAVETSGIWFQ